ncbi:MAG TPA: 16S rRNA (guanine(527)-N(7))-methyltransferase RsmG [Candidatus Cloacimonetes bacterium]|nr:16S rRNA (guanine(527)-N(7))-methyltransferase RsmG [Candidatus Cloacimonadota bacterium]
MIPQKEIFEQYLKEIRPENADVLMGQFEHYHKLLVSHNKNVNLISRKMSPDDYWVNHFLDSLLAVECLELEGKTVLDFGTGGGLPGIPIKLLVPEGEMVLLDSINKKIKALGEIVAALKLPKTGVECSRLEDYAYVARRPSFDFILCRAVALEERYHSPLRRLLKPSGKFIMYKSRNLDDLSGIRHEEICMKKDEILGERRLISVAQRDLMIR